MNVRHLHPGATASTRADTQEEIATWVAERRRVVTDLLAEQQPLDIVELEKQAA